MPSDRNNSPGTAPVSSAGSMPPETAGEIDPFSLLPSRQDTDTLLAEAAASQDEYFALLAGYLQADAAAASRVRVIHDDRQHDAFTQGTSPCVQSGTGTTPT